MKKAKIKKIITALLASTMLLSLVACGGGETAQVETESSAEVEESVEAADSAEKTGVSFPLEEEVTFEILVKSDAEVAPLLENHKFWQDLYEATNVKIEMVQVPLTDSVTAMNNLFVAGKEPDAIFSYFIPDTDISSMAANGLIVPLNDYINEDIMPNFTSRVVAENPNIMGLISVPGDKIYTLPKYEVVVGEYLESPFWINKNWVEQAGWKVEDIKTIDDLEAVLTYFRDNDMNGNGDTEDEIPYMIYQEHSGNHVEAFLGLYGIATKDSTYENYVTIKDGEVKFAPLEDGWKDAIKKLNDWYEKDLIWSEVFTGTWETYNAKTAGSIPTVGLLNEGLPPATNSEEYVLLEPVSVEGYETNWYIHPGINGGKNAFAVTKSCENVDILMAWIDHFYSFESSIRTDNGEEADGRWGYNAEGKVEFHELDDATAEKLMAEAPPLFNVFWTVPKALTEEDFAERIVLSDEQQLRNDSYYTYEKYLTDESWPRPYIAGDNATRLSELRVDIFSSLALKRAEWITGVADIDAEYDGFVEDIKKMGVDDFVSIMQETYDGYLASIQ